MASKNQSQELIILLESIMDFKRWGFKQSYILISHEIFPKIIYDSKSCRVMFSFEHAGEQYPLPPRLSVLYGRLHAPNDDYIMTVDGEKFWCWHDANNALRFLDGITPKEAADKWKAYQRKTPFVVSVIQTMIQKKISHPEIDIRTQSAIWEHYGQMLFEIYDVRNPDIWKKYAEFISEFNSIIGLESHFGYPTKDKIY